MTVPWNEFLETGVAEIDAQHKELFVRVNAYVKALMAEAGPEEIDRLFRFLNEYVDLSFSTEEKLLSDFSYPDISIHKAQHEYFKKRFASLKKIYDTHGVSDSLIQKIHKEVANWLVNHIAKTDKEWAVVIKHKKELMEKKPDLPGQP